MVSRNIYIYIYIFSVEFGLESIRECVERSLSPILHAQSSYLPFIVRSCEEYLDHKIYKGVAKPKEASLIAGKCKHTFQTFIFIQSIRYI